MPEKEENFGIQNGDVCGVEDDDVSGPEAEYPDGCNPIDEDKCDNGKEIDGQHPLDDIYVNWDCKENAFSVSSEDDETDSDESTIDNSVYSNHTDENCPEGVENEDCPPLSDFSDGTIDIDDCKPGDEGCPEDDDTVTLGSGECKGDDCEEDDATITDLNPDDWDDDGIPDDEDPDDDNDGILDEEDLVPFGIVPGKRDRPKGEDDVEERPRKCPRCPSPPPCPPQKECPPEKVCPECPPEKVCPECPPEKVCPACVCPEVSFDCPVCEVCQVCAECEECEECPPEKVCEECPPPVECPPEKVCEECPPPVECPPEKVCPPPVECPPEKECPPPVECPPEKECGPGDCPDSGQPGPGSEDPPPLLPPGEVPGDEDMDDNDPPEDDPPFEPTGQLPKEPDGKGDGYHRQSDAPGAQEDKPECECPDVTVGQIMQKINAYRTSKGLVALKMNQALMQAASSHAGWLTYGGANVDMAHPHTGALGSDAADRAKLKGYGHTMVWETWAPGNLCEVDVVQMWKDSPAHDAIMLQPDARDFGFGYSNCNSIGCYGFVRDRNGNPTNDSGTIVPPLGPGETDRSDCKGTQAWKDKLQQDADAERAAMMQFVEDYNNASNKTDFVTYRNAQNGSQWGCDGTNILDKDGNVIVDPSNPGSAWDRSLPADCQFTGTGVHNNTHVAKCVWQQYNGGCDPAIQCDFPWADVAPLRPNAVPNCYDEDHQPVLG